MLGKFYKSTPHWEVHPSSTRARTCFWPKRSWSYPRCRAKTWWTYFGESEESKRLICRIFSYLDGPLFKKLFTIFVRPHLEYGQVKWTPHLKKHITILENVQHRATKLMDCFPHMSYSERPKKLSLPSLVYRRARGDMIEIFKHFHSYENIVCYLKISDLEIVLSVEGLANKVLITEAIHGGIDLPVSL